MKNCYLNLDFGYLNSIERRKKMKEIITYEELDKIVELKPKSIEELKKLNILIPIKIKVHGECLVNEIIM